MRGIIGWFRREWGGSSVFALSLTYNRGGVLHFPAETTRVDLIKPKDPFAFIH